MARYAFTALVAMLATLTACNGSVNGPVTVGAGQKADDVSTVNGPISIEDGATVGGAMTVNGAISLGAKATAQSANGPLHFEHEVKLFISDSAQVSGPIEGATAEKFSGEKP